MTLQELLDLLREGIVNDRTDRVEGTSDYLWTDKTLITYINEAQRRFAVHGLVLRDATTDACTKIVLVTGQTEYQLHESVFAVMSAKLETMPADLNRAGHSLLGAYRSPTDTWIDPNYFSGWPPGPVVAYSTDEELSPDSNGSLSRVTLRIFPAPSAEQNGKVVRLRVVRKPINKLTPEDMDAYPEIPEDHHIEMLDWAAYLALRIVDDDAGAPKAAATFAAMFERSVIEARKLALTKMFAPMGWGFGRGGFSWSND